MFRDCWRNKFRCTNNIEKKEKEATASFNSAKAQYDRLVNESNQIQKQIEDTKDQLMEHEHYSSMYDHIPEPYEVGEYSFSTADMQRKFKELFGKSLSSSTDSRYIDIRIQWVNAGLSLISIPKDSIKALIDAYPAKLYNESEGYTEHDAFRFWAHINMSIFWNVDIWLIKVKGGYVNAYMDENKDIIYFNPVSKKMWKVNPDDEKDMPLFIIT